MLNWFTFNALLVHVGDGDPAVCVSDARRPAYAIHFHRLFLVVIDQDPGWVQAGVGGGRAADAEREVEAVGLIYLETVTLYADRQPTLINIRGSIIQPRLVSNRSQ